MKKKALRQAQGKVAVAMSGGVDSGVAAALLVKQGYKCTGFHMRLWNEAPPEVSTYFHPGGVRLLENKCCSTESLEAARKTAHKLGIPFYTIDFSKIFKKKVVDYFLKEYGLGRTPNPCVVCNKFIKFGELLDYAKELGYDYLATGHYAEIAESVEVVHRNFGVGFRFSREEPHVIKKTHRRSQGEASQNLVGSPRSFHLLMGKDKMKDQSYFLYNLTQEQLVHILFPVGDYTKREVVAMAKKWSLPVAERPESQEICFFPESDYRPFLKRQIREKIIPGEVVDTQGRVIGRHLGLPLYTIGQRHGFEIVGGKREVRSGIIPPFYVVGKDVKKNQLIVGFGKEAERKKFWVKEVNWVNPNFQFPISNFQLLVRIRHQGELLKCEVRSGKWDASREVRSERWVRVVLDEPERGIAPGQAAVFYRKDEVLGGGIIALDKN